MFLLSSVGFIYSLFLAATILNARFGLYEAPTIKVSSGVYAPKTGFLGRMGFSPLEAALIRKDFKAFTRRRELMQIFIIPIILIIMPILSTMRGETAPSPTISTFLSIYMALNISSGIISVFTDQAWILNYLPGSGAAGFIRDNGTVMRSISTGTDNIAANIINCLLYPSTEVAYLKFSLAPENPFTEVYREPLWFVLFRSLIIAFAYIIGLFAIAWYSFKRAQVLE